MTSNEVEIWIKRDTPVYNHLLWFTFMLKNLKLSKQPLVQEHLQLSRTLWSVQLVHIHVHLSDVKMGWSGNGNKFMSRRLNFSFFMHRTALNCLSAGQGFAGCWLGDFLTYLSHSCSKYSCHAILWLGIFQHKNGHIPDKCTSPAQTSWVQLQLNPSVVIAFTI